MCVVVAAAVVCGGTAVASAAERPPVLIPPVDGPISRFFEEPRTDFGPGHRGVDYAVASGTPVRAAAAGIVRFAGPVAGMLAVSIAHAGDVVTTYSALEEVSVTRGSVVGEGHWIGLAALSHPGGPQGLHFGVKLHDRYVDPLALLAPVDMDRALHLAPLVSSAGSESRSVAMSPTTCVDPIRPRRHPPPPNDNVVVMVAGIASATTDGHLPEIYGSYARNAFGYPSRRIYDFSYRGASGRLLHRPYETRDTFGDINAAAERLRELLERIGRRNPRRDVDIVAHSQGGVLARALLTRVARASDSGLPRVEHLVTLASPHRGTPVADLAGAPASGVAALVRAGWWGLSHLLPIPPPGSKAIEELSTRSDLTAALEKEDVAFGTRVLSLAMPHDLVVPVDRAALAYESNSVVAPEGLWGHSSILRSERARAMAYEFLRDGPGACRGPWDRVGPWIGRAVSTMWGIGARVLGR